MQNDPFNALLARYQGLPLFNNCPVKDANAVAIDGESILHKAVMMKDVMAVKMLLQHAANPNQAGAMGDTPLHQAVFNNNLEIAEILVNSGADVGIANEYGETILDLAKTQKSKTLFNFLNQV
ncbi:MAG: ankyrin repeat domain-containing protein [Rhodobacterales bacterium]